MFGGERVGLLQVPEGRPLVGSSFSARQFSEQTFYAHLGPPNGDPRPLRFGIDVSLGRRQMVRDRCQNLPPGHLAVPTLARPLGPSPRRPAEKTRLRNLADGLGRTDGSAAAADFAFSAIGPPEDQEAPSSRFGGAAGGQPSRAPVPCPVAPHAPEFTLHLFPRAVVSSLRRSHESES